MCGEVQQGEWVGKREGAGREGAGGAAKGEASPGWRKVVQEKQVGRGQGSKRGAKGTRDGSGRAEQWDERGEGGGQFWGSSASRR